MSKISKIQPVIKCCRCGKAVVVKELEVYAADPTGEILRGMLANLSKTALCDFHQKQREYYASQNRLQDWENGNL